MNWSIKKGEITAYVAQDIMNYVDWEWKSIDDIDEAEKQNGIRLGLQNHTMTYKEVLGNNWKEILG